MPNRFTPINSKAKLQQALQQINRNFQMLDAEANTKTVKQGGGNALVSGRLPNGKYGELVYDAQSVPRILLGQAPKDGRPGLWISKEGKDVLEAIE